MIDPVNFCTRHEFYLGNYYDAGCLYRVFSEIPAVPVISDARVLIVGTLFSGICLLVASGILVWSVSNIERMGVGYTYTYKTYVYIDIYTPSIAVRTTDGLVCL